MRNTVLLFSVLTVMGLAAAVPVQAQSVRIKASVPFEFSVDGKVLPAGDYLIKTESGTGLIQLSDADATQEVVMVTSLPAGEDKASSVGSRLVFAQYDNRYFLRQVWDTGRGTGRQLGESKIEREARVAAITRKSLTVLAKR